MKRAMDPAAAMELASYSQVKVINSAIGNYESPVQQFYCGATVLVTGATGLLGKQLMEKLFRACNVGKIYIIMRPKKGKAIRDRLDEALKDPVFEPVRSMMPGFENRIVPLEGDMEDIKIGLSDKDWNTLADEVEVIIHMAATTRFDEQLKVATLINVRGTREVLALGKACKKLKSFVHVSTAYANATKDTIKGEVQEKFYPTPVPPAAMISMAEEMDTETLNNISDQLTKGYPNTYTFAKRIAEDLIRSTSGDLPICIIRPAIVVPALREPLPGWADMSTAYSASGILIGPGLGLIHAAYVSPKVKFSLVPVDYANNAALVAGLETHKRHLSGNKKIAIYSLPNPQNLLCYGKFIPQAKEIGYKLGSPKSVYANFAYNTSNYPLFVFLTWFYHFIPAFVLDRICVLFGKPPMFLRLYKKAFNLSVALSYFTINHWYFNDDNTQRLFQSLSSNDKIIFNFDTKDIDMTELLYIWCIGLRKYVKKDGLEGTVKASRKQFWLHILNCFVHFVYVYCLWKILSVTVHLVVYALKSIYVLFNVFF